MHILIYRCYISGIRNFLSTRIWFFSSGVDSRKGAKLVEYGRAINIDGLREPQLRPHIIILWILLWVMCYHSTTIVVNHQIDSLQMWKKEHPSIPLPIMCLLKDYLNLSKPFLTLYPHVTFPAVLRKPYLIVIGPSEEKMETL